jgi:ABC-type Zn uptake system ZnuABC Zn-binding protein ZnuA
VASFPPIYCFVANVAGDDATVRTAMTSQGPHHFDPKQSDAAVLRQADLFFLNGLGLDERAAGKLKTFSANGKLKLIELGGKIDKKLLEEDTGDHEGHDHAHGHAHGGHDHPIDPHVWLGLDTAEQMVAGVRDELKAADPARAADYDRRAGEYVAKLQALRAKGKAMLADKKEREFVTTHESLTYFARSFGLTVHDVIQTTPGKEPKGEELDKLVKSMIEHKIRVIAVEPQYSSQGAATRVAEELKRKDVDAVLVQIDPLETANEADLNPGWYEAKMLANLDALKAALK